MVSFSLDNLKKKVGLENKDDSNYIEAQGQSAQAKQKSTDQLRKDVEKAFAEAQKTTMEETVMAGREVPFPSSIDEKKIPFANPRTAKKFIPTTANVAALMIRREDGTQIIDKFIPFTLIRDQETKIAWAVFKISKAGKMGKFRKITVKRLFNTELAALTIQGALAAFDATTFEQVPFTQNKELISIVHKLDRELTATTQGLILANTEAQRLKNKGGFIEKYGAQIMLFVAMVFLGIALIQLGQDIAGINTGISTLGGQITSLQTSFSHSLLGQTPT